MMNGSNYSLSDIAAATGSNNRANDMWGGAGANVVWNGTTWDSLGSINDVTDQQVQEAVNQFLTQNPIAPTLTDDGVLIL